MSFSWVPFYRELAGRVLEFEDKQDELIALLEEMNLQGMAGFSSNSRRTNQDVVDLRRIDPFTFFLLWNRGIKPNRREVCLNLKERWGLRADVPSDFDGIPLVHEHESRSFIDQVTGRSGEVAVLWRLARAAYDENPDAISHIDFKRALQNPHIRVAKLTVGLFWISPRKFLPLDSRTVARAQEVGIEITDSDLTSQKLTLTRYRKILEEMHEKLGSNHLEIALDVYSAKVTKKIMSNSQSLNQILYGPPGTGKTYNSIRRAVQIIDGEEGENPKARFEELRKAGQIEFVTFHQSFSYEEFIEGLRPVIGDESGQVSYEIRDGILKQLAQRALLNPPITTRRTDQVSFEEIWSQLESKIYSMQTTMVEGLTNRSRYKLYFDEGELRGQNMEGGKYISYQSSEEKQKEVWEKFKDRRKINCKDHYEFKPKESASRGFIVAVFNHMKILEEQISTTTVDFVKKDAPRFVLIIDEINRGNISKILGELITLLEDDKRIGAENELRLTLPTSGDSFALPPNLYILGTMNTSDKSLAQLDVALRRRFSFEEMPPILSLCNQLDGLPAVLKELNDRLEWALDREHRLGHAYFMNVDSPAAFDEIFRSKIVPLLIEYFPHDFQTLRAVLGEKADGFLREMTKPKDFPGSGKKYRWWFEGGDKSFSAFARLKSNYEV